MDMKTSTGYHLVLDFAPISPFAFVGSANPRQLCSLPTKPYLFRLRWPDVKAP